MDAKIRPSLYNKKQIRPKLYPAFKRFARFKLSDILKMIKIKKDNMKMENKISEIKSEYEINLMKKEARKQKEYLNNLLNRPKSIPYAPQLSFLSIDQINNRIKRIKIKSQKHYMTQTSIYNDLKRNSMRNLRNNTHNISIKLTKNKSTNNRTNISINKKNDQNSKNRKSLEIEYDNNYYIRKKDMINSTFKKSNKKETTTKCTTMKK